MTKGYEQRKVSNEKYLAKMDNVLIRMPKGEKDALDAFVCDYGYSSRNQFVLDAIEHYKEVVMNRKPL